MNKKNKDINPTNKLTADDIDIMTKKKHHKKDSINNKWISSLKQDPVTDEQSHVQLNYKQFK